MQDDLRLRPNLTFSPGLRYEMQTHVHDLTGFGPRLGLTWAPGKNGAHDDSRQLRHLLQLARHQRLRADAARRRRPPAGNQHREPVVSKSGRRRDVQRQQQVRARRHRHGAHPSLQRRDRSHVLAEAARQPDLRDGALSQPAARREPERAGARRAPRSRIRQHHRGDLGRVDGHLRTGAGLQRQFRRRRPQCRSGEVESAADDGAVQLPASPRLQQHRRLVQRVAERLARRSVGAGRRRHVASHARVGVDAGATGTSTRK